MQTIYLIFQEQRLREISVVSNSTSTSASPSTLSGKSVNTTVAADLFAVPAPTTNRWGILSEASRSGCTWLWLYFSRRTFSWCFHGVFTAILVSVNKCLITGFVRLLLMGWYGGWYECSQKTKPVTYLHVSSSFFSSYSMPNLSSDLFDLQPAFVPTVQSTPAISTSVSSAWGGELTQLFDWLHDGWILGIKDKILINT